MHALIPAAGRAVRFGTGENKLFSLLAGKTVIRQTVERIAQSVDTVTLIGRVDELEKLKSVCGDIGSVHYMVGGETRQQSVLSGLLSLKDVASPNDVALVHDGARPLVSKRLIEKIIEQANQSGFAIAARPITETIKLSESSNSVLETRDRTGLWTAQTPQAGTYYLLLQAIQSAEAAGFAGTDESSAIERLGQTVKIVEGDYNNIKITTQADLAWAEQYMLQSQPMTMRIGTGYDVHRLVEGRRLILGGVDIPSTFGLLGHSDADVLLHAICDAILGAAGLPDIGNLYPNTDPSFAGIDSLLLLGDVQNRVRALQYEVGNVDSCVIAERPKISEYTKQMKKNIADTLHISPEQVSIKATTNEGLGALGAGEGIAAHASVMLFRKIR